MAMSSASQRRNKQGLLQLRKGRNNWKNYMFKVTSSTYFHYFNPKDLSKPKDQIILSTVKSVEAVSLQSKGGLHAFEVKFSGKGSPWTVGCTSQEEQIAWMEAIKPGSSLSLQEMLSGPIRQSSLHVRTSPATAGQHTVSRVVSTPQLTVPSSPPSKQQISCDLLTTTVEENAYTLEPSTSPPPPSPTRVCVPPRPPVMPQDYLDPRFLNMPSKPFTTCPLPQASSCSNPHTANFAVTDSFGARSNGRAPCAQPQDDYVDMTYSLATAPDDRTSSAIEHQYLVLDDTAAHTTTSADHTQGSSKPTPQEILSSQFTPEQIQLLTNMLDQLRMTGRRAGGGHTPPPHHRPSNDFGYLVSRTADSLPESILVTEDDDPDTYDKRPSWAKAVYEELSEQTKGDELHALQYDAFTIQRSDISQIERIGEGQFGAVYKAMYTPTEGGVPVSVAVKTSKSQSSSSEVASFMKEMAVMATMMHPNIVRLYGVVTREVQSPWLVLEFLSHGDLKSFLIRSGGKPVDQLVKYMVDIAMGMHYLAEKGLVHRDLAARNILVGENELCKVADFGLLRELPDDDSIYKSTSSTPCPIRWMAPESLSKRVFSVASDVWSYGVLQWEMFFPKKLPYHGMDNFQVATRISKGYRMPVPRGCPAVIARVMKACWHSEPRKRPSFLLIATLLSTRSNLHQTVSTVHDEVTSQ